MPNRYSQRDASMGLTRAFGLTKPIASLLYGVKTRDPLTGDNG